MNFVHGFWFRGKWWGLDVSTRYSPKKWFVIVIHGEQFLWFNLAMWRVITGRKEEKSKSSSEEVEQR